MDAILQIPILIIKEQEQIIGPLAWEEAGKVAGLNINQSHSAVSFTGDAKDVINRLVAQYERLFGMASREVCKNAAAPSLANMAAADIPSSLK
jgi:hypothetical protein